MGSHRQHLPQDWDDRHGVVHRDLARSAASKHVGSGRHPEDRFKILTAVQWRVIQAPLHLCHKLLGDFALALVFFFLFFKFHWGLRVTLLCEDCDFRKRKNELTDDGRMGWRIVFYFGWHRHVNDVRWGNMQPSFR